MADDKPRDTIIRVWGQKSEETGCSPVLAELRIPGATGVSIDPVTEDDEDE